MFSKCTLGRLALASLGLAVTMLAVPATAEAPVQRPTIHTDPPAVDAVEITSRPITVSTVDDTLRYGPGDIITVEVDFYPGVEIVPTCPAAEGESHQCPVLHIVIGTQVRNAQLTEVITDSILPEDPEFSFTTMIFEHEVTATDRDLDGITIHANALTSPTGIMIRAIGGGDAANLDLADYAIVNDNAHQVGTNSLPSFDPTTVTYRWIAGTAVTVQLPAAMGGDAPLSYPVIPSRPSWLARSSSDPRELFGTAPATSQAGSFRMQVRDADGDTAYLTVNYAVYRQPTVDAVFIESTPEDFFVYHPGEVIEIAVDIYPAVTVEPECPTAATYRCPELTIEIGDQPRTARLVEVESTGDTRTPEASNHSLTTLYFEYQVAVSDYDLDGISILANALDPGTVSIRSIQGNVLANLDLGDYAIMDDGDHPTDDNDSLTFAPATVHYRWAAGRKVDVLLPAAVGGTDVTYPEFSSRPVWLKRSPVAPRRLTGTAPAQVESGSFRMQAYSANDDYAYLVIKYTLVRPTIDSVFIASIPEDFIVYYPGEVIEVEVDFSPAVAIDPECPAPTTATHQCPELAIAIGDQRRTARLVDVTPPGPIHTPEDFEFSLTTLHFAYQVMVTDYDFDGISIPADALDSGTVSIHVIGGNASAVLDLGDHAITDDGDHPVEDNDSLVFAPATVTYQWVGGREVNLLLPAATGGTNVTYPEFSSLPSWLIRSPTEPRRLIGVAPNRTVAGTFRMQAHSTNDDYAYLVINYTVEAIDINADGKFNADDALILYYALTMSDALGTGSESAGQSNHRATFLQGLTPLTSPTDADLRNLLRRANAAASLSAPTLALDVNQLNSVTAADATAIYLALAFPELVGGVSQYDGFAKYRRILLSQLANQPQPTDGDLLQLIQRIRGLQ